MEQTSNGFIKNLKMIHKVMVAFHVLVPLAITFLIKFVNTKVKKYDQFHKYMQWVLPIVLVVCVVYATFIFKKRVDAILAKHNQTLKQKLFDYRAASIVRWSIIDMPIGLSTAMLLLTGNYYYLIFAFISLIFMVMYTPSKEQILAHLQLSTTEQAVLEDEYAVIE